MLRTISTRALGGALVSFFALVGFAACGSSPPGSGTSAGSGTGGMQAVAISVSADKAHVLTCATEQLTAAVTGTTDTAVSWSLGSDAPNLGKVDAQGLYTAPIQRPAPNGVTVVAKSHADPTKSATSTLFLVTAEPQKPVVAGSSLDATCSSTSWRRAARRSTAWASCRTPPATTSRWWRAPTAAPPSPRR